MAFLYVIVVRDCGGVPTEMPEASRKWTGTSGDIFGTKLSSCRSAGKRVIGTGSAARWCVMGEARPVWRRESEAGRKKWKEILVWGFAAHVFKAACQNFAI